MSYIGNQVDEVNSTLSNSTQSLPLRTAVATEGQTTFALAYNPYFRKVYLNGVLLDEGDFTAANGTQIVLAAGCAAGDVVTVDSQAQFRTSGSAPTDSPVFTGEVGINTASVEATLDIQTASNATKNAVRIVNTGTGHSLLVEDSASPDSTPFIIANDGRILSGHTGVTTLASGVPRAQFHAANGITALDAISWANSQTHNVGWGKSRSATPEALAAVLANDQITHDFRFDTGVDFQLSARIGARVSANATSTELPTDLFFSTRAAGSTSTSERVRITSGGDVGIGTSTPLGMLHVSAGASASEGLVVTHSGTAAAVRVTQTGAGDVLVVEDSTSPDASALVVNANGQLVSGGRNAGNFAPVGLSASRVVAAGTTTEASLTAARIDASNAPPELRLIKSRGASEGTRGAIADQDGLGRIRVFGDDGVTGFVSAATIDVFSDGAPASGSVPSSIRFGVTAAGGTGPIERMRITAAGNVGIGTASPSARLDVNGTANVAGDLTVGGNLSVNGTVTTFHSTITTLDDPIVTLGGDTAPTADDNKDRGVEFRWHDGTAAKVGFFGFDDSTGYLTFIPDATNASEVFSGTLGDIQAANFRGALIGNASTATTLATARTIAMTGDVTWTSAAFNGSANVTGTATLANSGVTAGTYRSVTVDAKGRVTAGTNPTTLAGYGITDAVATGSAASLASVTVTGSTAPANGMYLPAANTLALSTATTERVRVLADGKVGIGTTAPLQELHVFGSAGIMAETAVAAGSDQLTARNGSSASTTTKFAGLRFQGVSTTGTAKDAGFIRSTPLDPNYDGTHMTFWTRAGNTTAERMCISSTGHVGIGVAPSNWGASNLALEFSAGSLYSTITGIGMAIVGNGYYNGTSWLAKQAGGVAAVTADNGKVQLWTAPSVAAGAVATLSPRLTVDSNGFVAIGGSTPETMLDVAGNLTCGVRDGADANVNIGYNRTADGAAYIGLQSQAGSGGSVDYNMRVMREAGVNGSGVIEQRGTGALQFGTRQAAPTVFFNNNVERVRITSDGAVGIGTVSPGHLLDVMAHSRAGNARGYIRTGAGSDQYAMRLGSGLDASGVPYGLVAGPRDGNAWLAFTLGATDQERMRIDSSGSVLIGGTAANGFTTGRGLLALNGSTDSMVSLSSGGTFVGYLAGTSSNVQIDAQGSRSITFNTNGAGRVTVDTVGTVRPATTDGTQALGAPTFRWSQLWAAAGTIATSDANLKTEIANLDEAERAVAVAIKGLIKKFKFKDAVAAKGAAARIHVGVIAQEVAVAFEAEGLDVHDYALFCEDTWYEATVQSVNVVNGGKDELVEERVVKAEPFEGATEVARLGVRYEELLAFVIAAL